MKFAESDAPAADVKGVIISFRMKSLALETELPNFDNDGTPEALHCTEQRYGGNPSFFNGPDPKNGSRTPKVEVLC